MVARRSSAGAAARRIADTATAVASEPKAGPFASAARALHAIGLWVLPLVAEGDGKSPHVQDFTRWQRRPGRAALAKWEECWPDANIGILTGNLVVVVDVDDATLIPKMLERFGPTPLQVRTPSGGGHLYYRASGEDCTTLRPGLPVDIKAQGGYVVAPPSIRPSGEHAGRQYELHGSWDDVRKLPALRHGTLPRSNEVATDNPIRLRAIPVGVRSRTLVRELLRKVHHVDTREDLLDVARTIADQHFEYHPASPFTDADIEKAVGWVWKTHSEGRNWVGRPAQVTIAVAELDMIAVHPHSSDMALLLVKLRLAHSGLNAEFAISPKAMADKFVIPAWRDWRRYRNAFRALVEIGLLEIIHRGGARPGDVTICRFACQGYNCGTQSN
jgi:hypothetical protein